MNREVKDSSLVKGAVAGAAVGGVGGSMGGQFGKGATVGAVAGGALGAVKDLKQKGQASQTTPSGSQNTEQEALYSKKIINQEEKVMKTKASILFACLLFSISAFTSGCVEDMSAAQKGAVAGAAAGGAAGGILGGSRSSTLIGAGVGAAGGALLNEELHKKKNK